MNGWKMKTDSKLVAFKAQHHSSTEQKRNKKSTRCCASVLTRPDSQRPAIRMFLMMRNFLIQII